MIARVMSPGGIKELIMRKKIFSLILVIACVAGTSVYLSAAEPDFQKMLKEIDDLGNFEGKDFSCIYTIVSEKPGEDVDVTQARMFRRDLNDQFVLLIMKPDAKRGQGYLQVDENVWFYDPESRKFEKSTIKENIQESDAQNSDIKMNTLSKDYAVVRSRESKLGDFDVYILDLAANNKDVSYDKIKVWIRKDKTIILKEEDYSVNERLMRTILFPNYVTVDGKYTPSKVLIIDELNAGEKTQLTMKDPSVSPIPDYVFTKTYIEKVSN